MRSAGFVRLFTVFDRAAGAYRRQPFSGVTPELHLATLGVHARGV
jgi:hypothetical protein